MTATLSVAFARDGVTVPAGERSVINADVVADNRQHASAQPAPSSDITFDVITSRSDFDALADDWNDLFSRAARPPHVFQSFGFLWHWANCYHTAQSPERLVILTGRRNGHLAVVWPLVLNTRAGLKTLSWMGDPVAQYGDILAAPDAADAASLDAAYAALRSRVRFDVLHLRRVRDDATIKPLLARIDATASDERHAPALSFGDTPSFDAFELRYAKKPRNNRRRLMRRLSENHTFNFVRPPNGPEARALAMHAVELKTKWLAQRGLFSPAFTSPAFKKFFADTAEGRGHTANCAVSALVVDGETAAIDVTFLAGGVSHLHIVVYHPKFEKSGVGTLLLEDDIRDACEHKLAGFDFLAPTARYKEDWADSSIAVFDWSKPVSVTGAIYAKAYVQRLRPMLRAMLQALPASVRQRLSRSSLKRGDDSAD